jgi:hypothetical protein
MTRVNHLLFPNLLGPLFFQIPVGFFGFEVSSPPAAIFGREGEPFCDAANIRNDLAADERVSPSPRSDEREHSAIVDALGATPVEI